jgi:uncharacterized protein DUF3800
VAGAGHAPATAKVLLEGLSQPGRTLIFCDDTDIAGQPVPWLQRDLRILVAVEIESESYVSAAAEMMAHLAVLGMPEFHAADMANPNKKSPWKAIDPGIRVEALHVLAGILTAAGARFYQARVPKAQFASLKALAQEDGKVGVGFKHGLKRVFLRCLFEHLAASDRPALVVIDQDKPLAEPVIEHWPEAWFLVGGGPVAASSKDVPGLQLADMAAWSINRILCRRPCFDDGSATAVDRAALEVVGNLNGGLGDLIAMSSAAA